MAAAADRSIPVVMELGDIDGLLTSAPVVRSMAMRRKGAGAEMP
jgi:hypothetical protein